MFNGSIEIFLKNFSFLIRHYREKNSLTQAEVAHALGISHRTYQRIETGESEPSLSIIYKSAYFLKFQPEEIFRYENKLTNEEKLLWLELQNISELTEVARIGLWSFDIETKELHWSNVVKLIHEVEQGYQPTVEEAINFYKPGPNLEAIKNSVNLCMTKGIPYYMELELISHKKNPVFIMTAGFAEKIDNKIVRIQGFIQDISPLKRLNNQLKHALDELSDITKFANLGRWELDIVENNLSWSEGIFTIFEIDPNQGTPSYKAFLNLVHPEDRELLDHTYHNSLKNKLPYEIEHRLLMPDGRIKWVQEKCISYFSKSGEPLKSIGYALDITKFKTNI